MALIKCPECKKEFFDTDKVCPNCGYKLPTELSNKQIILIIGALAVGIVLIIILAFVIANKEDEASAKKEQPYEEPVKFSQPEEDFTTKTITVELGSSLPEGTENYVVPSEGEELTDEYTIDFSRVKPEIVGDYTYSVTYKTTTKKGVIKITDTTSPKLELKSLTIKEGTTYEASDFVGSCTDLSGCSYYFHNGEGGDFTKPGVYTVFIDAADAYHNLTTEKVQLTIK